MKLILLNSNMKDLNQSNEIVIPVDGSQRRVYVELRYLEATGKWYLTMEDVETGESYFRYVPVVASYTSLNDLVSPFSYKDIGQILCVPVVNSPSSVNPTKNNLNEFAIVWGDNFAE